MWTRALLALLGRAIRSGALDLTLPDGSLHRFGAGDPVQVTLHDPGLPRRLILNPQLALGEGYVEGGLTIAGDDLHGLLRLIIAASEAGDLPLAQRLAARGRRAIKGLRQFNPLAISRRNVAHHYDLSEAFYRTFLDPDLQYTCAYFRDPADDLDTAQQAKMDHVATKLCLRPGLTVLEIGCGWGGFALQLAARHGVRVTGITLSEVQLASARAQAQAVGLADRVQFLLQDYRAITGVYDRIVSIGMMEHVGVPHYPRYFRTIARSLAADGIALVHVIGRTSPPGVLSPWFHKYIFPGGYAPALSEVLPAVEASGLRMADVEVWRGHYARTLQAWQARFATNLPQVRALQDDRFVRMWRYYLISAELSFTDMHQVVFQMQLAHNPLTVPTTRDYLSR